jgi:hypothetical protein
MEDTQPRNIIKGWISSFFTQISVGISTPMAKSVEEFGHLITPEVTSLLLESLRNCTIGDTYRVSGVNNDNLYAAYTNLVSS